MMRMVDAEAPLLTEHMEYEPSLAGVSDFHGCLVYRSTSGGWRSALFVVVVEVASAFAYYGVSANLITYLTGPLGHSNAAAAAAVNVWSGTATLMPLLGAFVADSWLGRYRSIIVACILYVLGYAMITLSTVLLAHDPSLQGDTPPHPFSLQVVFFYASLYLIAIAQGADNPCALAFAADQFDPDHPRECAARSSLFNWWYFSLAVGITVSVGLVGYIQETLGWGIGFGMLCALMLCAFVVFLLGTPTYRLYEPTPGADSPFALLARSLAALSQHDNAASSSLLGTNIEYQLVEGKDVATNKKDARAVLRLLSIWVACLSYGVAFAQVMTLFNKQGRTLDRRIFGVLELPPAALQTLGPASALLFVPIYDRVLVPALRRTTGSQSGLTLLQRVGTGLALTLASMLVAALVETRRLETARDHGLVDDVEATVPMCWAWLVPQYVLIGVAGVFAEVGMQEFFYDQMPSELRSLGMALYYSVIGMGNFFSGTLVSLIDRITSTGGGDSWFADNLNRAHLDYFYWLLAGFSAAELALFLRCASNYVYSHKRIR